MQMARDIPHLHSELLFNFEKAASREHVIIKMNILLLFLKQG